MCLLRPLQLTLQLANHRGRKHSATLDLERVEQQVDESEVADRKGCEDAKVAPPLAVLDVDASEVIVADRCARVSASRVTRAEGEDVLYWHA